MHRHDKPDRLKIDSPIGFIRPSANLPDQKLDAFIFETAPGAVLPREKANGEFFYYLLSGRLKVAVGAEAYELRLGDSDRFDANNGYLTENPPDQTVKVPWVGTLRC